jgi:hypothetical protein
MRLWSLGCRVSRGGSRRLVRPIVAAHTAARHADRQPDDARTLGWGGNADGSHRFIDVCTNQTFPPPEHPTALAPLVPRPTAP